MGRPATPTPAALIIGVIRSPDQELAPALRALEPVLGPLAQPGPRWPFSWSDYYTGEMGSGLERCFLRAVQPVPREVLAEVKRWTNRIERRLAAPDGRRRINLDPGLLSLESFSLATTKAQPQRIYLDGGIWAEVSLLFRNGRFEPLPWTYPDYRSEPVRRLLAELRQQHKRNLRSGCTPLGAGALAAALRREQEVEP
jgi:hypothetical protein